VFVSRRDGNAELYLMDADGTNQIRLTDTPENEVSPSWSPDGTEIAFSFTDGAGDHVAVMGVDGANRRTIVAGVSPAWSPTGQTIAYVRVNHTGCFLGVCPRDIRTVKPDGSRDAGLITGAAEPAWSPDGRRIAYRLLPKLFEGPGGLRIMTVRDRTVV